MNNFSPQRRKLFTSIFCIILGYLSISNSDAKTVKISILAEVPELVKDPEIFKSIPIAVELAYKSKKDKLKKEGIEVVFDYYQNKMDPEAIYKTMKQVFNSDAIAAVGFRSSAGVEYASKITQGTNFIAVSPFASSSKVFELKPNFFTIAASNKETASHLEEFIVNDLKAKRQMAIVAWDSTYSRDFYQSFSTKFSSKTKLVKTWESLDGIEKELENIKKYKPDVIILPNFPVVSASLIRLLVNEGLKAVFVGPESWGEGDYAVMNKVLKNIDFNSYTIRQFSVYNLTEKQKELKRLIEKNPGAKYATVSGLYHDSTLITLELLIKSKENLTRDGVFKSAKDLKEVNGVMGKSCLSSDRCQGRKFTIVNFTNRGYKIHKVMNK